MNSGDRRAVEIDIERLIKRYVNLNDAQDWNAVAGLYTEDARFARPSKPGEYIEGREAILASFLARPPRAQRHVIANTVVDVEGPATARAFATWRSARFARGAAHHQHRLGEREGFADIIAIYAHYSAVYRGD